MSFKYSFWKIDFQLKPFHHEFGSNLLAFRWNSPAILFVLVLPNINFTKRKKATFQLKKKATNIFIAKNVFNLKKSVNGNIRNKILRSG